MTPVDGVSDRAAPLLALRRENEEQEAAFAIEDELEGPWEEGYAYHHVLARRGDG